MLRSFHRLVPAPLCIALAVGAAGAGEPLRASPRFHRTHHALGLGHESAGRRAPGGCDFGVPPPVRDILFGSARFARAFAATGVRDQLPRMDDRGQTIPGRDYGRGFRQQQRFGPKRMARFGRRGAF